MNIRRIVLDTNVLVSAMLSPDGNPAKIYKLFLTGALSLFLSADIMIEYQDVLHRPRLRIPPNDADIVLAAIGQHGEIIEVTPSAHAIADEDDRVFYDTAKSADAYLITGNIKHYPKELFIVTPTEFLSL